jgi:hypothetical protein
MINERGCPIWRRMLAIGQLCGTQAQIVPVRLKAGGPMTSALTAVGTAIGGTSLICYLLRTRPFNRRADRGSSGDCSSGPGGGSYSSGDGWSLFSSSGGGDSSSDNSDSSSDSGGGDSGGGGDGGGGGD